VTFDPEAVEAAFAGSVDRTVGIEEEFAILDPASLELTPRFEELRDAADEVLAASISGELISSEIEIRSGRGEDVHAALAAQRDARRRLFALARRHDLQLGATGTHPFSDYREQRNIDTEHYRRVVEGLQYVARRNNTFSLHVHVGVRDVDRAVNVCDRLRPHLPTLLALSANSPFLDARHSGLHTARTQSFTKSFPRCGIPDAYGSWTAFSDYVDFLFRSESIVEYTQVWWSIRPHFSFGTVEVRICDAQMTAAESDALSELIVAVVAQAARDHDDGLPAIDHPRYMIEENFWRAIRFGAEAQLIDLDTRTARPARAAIEELLTWTAPVRAELGLQPDFPEHNGAQRQRAALAGGNTMHEVFAATVAETHATYAPEVPTP
jgi:carboxylate-amine ligase